MSRTVLLRVEDTAKQCKTRVQIWARTSNGTFQCFSVLLLPKMAGPEHRSCRQPAAISLSPVFEKPLSPDLSSLVPSLYFSFFSFFHRRFVQIARVNSLLLYLDLKNSDFGRIEKENSKVSHLESFLLSIRICNQLIYYSKLFKTLNKAFFENLNFQFFSLTM